MKVNQIVKAVAAVTTLGVFLAGCSGGDNTATRATSTPTTSSTKTTLPTASGSTPTVNGGGTTTVGGNAVIDDVAAKQAAQDAKLDQILAAANSANSNASSANKNSKWAMWIGAGTALAIAAGAIANGVREAQSEDKDASFIGGLFNSKLGQNSAIAKKEADAAVSKMSNRLDTTDGKVGQVESSVNGAAHNTKVAFGELNKDVNILKTAAGADILIGLNNLKATGEVGAKTAAVQKGQDELAKNARIVLTNTKSIQESSSKILESQTASARSEKETADALVTMNKKYSESVQTAAEMKKNLDEMVVRTSDEREKARLTAVAKEIQVALDKQMEDSRLAMERAFTKAREDYKVDFASLASKYTEATKASEGLTSARAAPVEVHIHNDGSPAKHEEKATMNTADSR